jgi:hypothetical protein
MVYLNVHIWPKIVGKKIGQFGQNLAKKWSYARKSFSQPRGLRFHSNKYDFLKLE